MSLWRPWYVYRPSLVARSLLARRAKGQERFREITTAFGAKMVVDSRDAIGRALLHNEIYEIAVSELLARAAASGAATLVDVGANIGYMSVLMAAFARPSATVFAFEPHPDNFAALQKNIERNNYGSRIVSKAMALTDHSGTASLHIPSSFAANNGLGSLETADGPSIPVAADTLDHQFADRRIDLLKIDVEGHELGVLHGARGLLSRGAIDAVVFEAHGARYNALENFLGGFGMVIYAVNYGMTGVRLSAANAGRAGKYESPNYLAVRPGLEQAFRHPRFGWRCLRQP
jgi:FkbM family methyltransferase